MAIPQQENRVLQRTTVALIATVVIHLSVASGIIWGGWLDAAGAGTREPAEMMLTIDLTPPPKPPPPTKQQFVPTPKETEPPEVDNELYSNQNSQASSEPTERPDSPDPFIDAKNDLFSGTLHNPVPIKNSSPTPQSSSASAAPSTLGVTATPAISGAPFTAADLHPVAPSIPNTLNQASAKLNSIEPGTGPDSLPPLPPIIALPPGNISSDGPPLAQVQAAMTQNDFSTKGLNDGGNLPNGAPGLNVKLTGFGAYDARFVEKVRLAWLRFRGKPGWLTPGVIVVEFRLHQNGNITRLRVVENSGHNLQAFYCSQAIDSPAPFEEWTETMKRAIGASHRDCKFTFRYLR